MATRMSARDVDRAAVQAARLDTSPELSKRIGDAISSALLLGFAAGFIGGGLTVYMLFRMGVFT